MKCPILQLFHPGLHSLTKYPLNPLKTGTFANSENPDAAFYQGQHCFNYQDKTVFREIHYLENITCHPSIYTMDYPYLNVSSFVEISIGLQRLSLYP